MSSLLSQRVLIAGHFAEGSLERSYCAAFGALGYEVVEFDMIQILNRYVRLGPLGHMLSLFVRVEPWIRKMGRELVITVLRQRPDLVVTIGHYPFRPGPLAQLKAATRIKLVHIWPDTLINWTTDLTTCLPLYDLMATYSQTSVPTLQRLGAARVAWVPLAGDPMLHPAQRIPPQETISDITFIGGWRPEREEVLSQLAEFELKIWGSEWGRRCKDNKVIQKAWQRQAAWGGEFARIVARSKINLNIIDQTNYPAANMRFFEIPTAGGLQICSPCPEMENEFRHGEHLFYYREPEELRDLIRAVLSDEQQRRRVAQAAHEKILLQHTYVHRVRSIVQELGQLS